MSSVTVQTSYDELRVGEARALRVCGAGPDTVVFLDDRDQVTRLRAGKQEQALVTWEIEQILRDVLDPHSVSEVE